MTKGEVEAVARAIFESDVYHGFGRVRYWDEEKEHDKNIYRADACMAITGLRTYLRAEEDGES